MYAQEWISVKDRLPDGDVLLLTTSKIIIIGDLYQEKWRSAGHWRHDGMKWVSDYEYHDITHWMPLPEPPQVKQ